MGKHVEWTSRWLMADGRLTWELNGAQVGEPLDFNASPAEVARIFHQWQLATSGFGEATIGNLTLGMFEGMRQFSNILAEDRADADKVRALLRWRGVVTVTADMWGPDEPPREPVEPPTGGIGVAADRELVAVSRGRWAKQPDGSWSEVEKLPV